MAKIYSLEEERERRRLREQMAEASTKPNPWMRCYETNDLSDDPAMRAALLGVLDRLETPTDKE